MKSILDPSFRYTSSAHTDLRKTFERVRHEQRITETTGVRRPRRVIFPTLRLSGAKAEK